jgi:hypothetical protein
MTTHPAHLRNRILHERGIRLIRDEAHKHRRLVVTPDKVNITRTTHMRLLEIQFGKSILDIVVDGSTREVEKKYGIDRTTVSKWRKRIAKELLSRVSNGEITLGNQEV